MHVLALATHPRGPRRVGWFFITLLIALISILGTGANPAWAMPLDPIDPDPIGNPEFTPPTNGFWWRMHSRFGRDHNGDQMIDYHWNPTSATYNQAYVNPSSYSVTLDGCRSWDEADTNYSANLYSWLIDDQAISGHACRIEHAFPAQGSYLVRLTVEGQPVPF